MKAILTVCLLLFTASMVKAQTISDDAKRLFDELSPIKIDLDGDGRPDTIQPRVYAVVTRFARGKRLRRSVVQHWIAFDLIMAEGRRIRSFFKYQYGTDEAEYWVYALIPAGEIKGDGRTDLVFYSGDDTSDETIMLINKGKRFIVHSRKRTNELSLVQK